MLCALAVRAADVTLAWTASASPNVTNYVVYFGTNGAGNYSIQVDGGSGGCVGDSSSAGGNGAYPISGGNGSAGGNGGGPIGGAGGSASAGKGNNGTAPGGGGSGSATGAFDTQGVGADGVVIVESYFTP